MMGKMRRLGGQTTAEMGQTNQNVGKKAAITAAAVFSVLLTASTLFMVRNSGVSISNILLDITIIVVLFLWALCFKTNVPSKCSLVTKPLLEVIIVLLWYIGYFVFGILTPKGEHMILGDAQVFVFLFVLPIFLLLLLHMPFSSFVDFMKSTGFSFVGFKKGFMMSLIAFPIPVIVLFADNSKRVVFLKLLSSPIKAIAAFFICFIMATLFAGLPEEFFFRGLLQSRLSKVFHSGWAGIFIASLLFGLYHFPSLYLNPVELSSGNVMMAFSSAVTEQAFAGLLFGYLFEKTRNLPSCIFLHGFIDAFFMIQTLKM